MPQEKIIQNMSEYVRDALVSGQTVPFTAVKCVPVQARQGTLGEEIVTVTQDGYETHNVVTADEKTGQPSWVVRNPRGVEYIVLDSEFNERYTADPNKEGVYRPAPTAKPIIALQVSEDISFKAPWGEDMHIKAGGFLNIANPQDIYGIATQEFSETYLPTDSAMASILEQCAETYDIPINELAESVVRACEGKVQENGQSFEEYLNGIEAPKPDDIDTDIGDNDEPEH